MSTLPYSGQYFNNDLNVDFKYQNQTTPQTGEIQNMSISLLDDQSKGYQWQKSTNYGNLPILNLNYINSNISTTILTYTPPTSLLMLNEGNNISGLSFNVPITVLNPTLPSNPSTRGYVDNSISSVPNQIVLTGDIIGSGTTSTNVITTFQKTLNQINNSGNININNFLLNNVANPLTSKDGANKEYVDTKFAAAGTVTSIAISGSTGLSVSGSPITTTGIINLSLNQNLQLLSSLSTTGLIRRVSSSLYSTIPSGTDGQVLASSTVSGFQWITPNAGTVTSIGITGSTGITALNTPVTTSGNINLTLSSELQGISNLSTLGLIYRTSVGNYSTQPINGSSGQFLGINGSGNLQWTTPTGAGNVVGANYSITNSLPVFADTTGKSLTTSFLTITNGVSTSLLSNVTDPVNNQDVATKNFVNNIPHGLNIFTTGSGTWTVPNNVTSFTVTLVGGGGGGGGASIGSSSGGGGGGGGSAIKKYTGINPGTTYNYAVGNAGIGGILANLFVGTDGGNTTFGTLIANGGKGGPAGNSSLTTMLAGGLGGTSTGGDINLQGGQGGCVLGQNNYKSSGAGGNSILGQGAIGVGTPGGNSVSGATPSSTAYGAAGSGGLKISGADVNGGNGINGVIIIEW